MMRRGVQAPLAFLLPASAGANLLAPMRPGHFVALVLVAAPVAAFAGSPPSPPNRWTNRVSNAPRGGADTSCEAATSEADLSAVLGENAALLES